MNLFVYREIESDEVWVVWNLFTFFAGIDVFGVVDFDDYVIVLIRI